MTPSPIDQIFELFERFGEQHYGEDASQLQHALQAAELARREGCADSLVAASLLHDVGQFIRDAGNAAERSAVDARHEVMGANYLSLWFSVSICDPVRLHVAAKRYLCTIDPAYADGLSHASVLSLRLQGGAMSEDEVRAFEAEPFYQDAITLRRFDDMGKQADWELANLESYRPLLESLLVNKG